MEINTSETNLSVLESKDEAFGFVSALTGSTDSSNIFTVINSKTKQVRDFTGSISNLYEKLQLLNRSGYCVFMVVNECAGPRKADNIKAPRANFFDDDLNGVKEMPLEASILVQSARGIHGYYLIRDAYPLEKFSSLQKAISKKLGTDPTVCDLPRIMRVPGFIHMKNPIQPRSVKLLSAVGKKYSFNEISKAFELKEEPEIQAFSEYSIEPSAEIGEFLEWANKLPAEEGASNRYGGRNKTALILIREGYGQKIPQQSIGIALEAYCLRSGLPFSEVETMLDRQSHEDSIKNFKSFFAKTKKESMAPARLAEKFLKECNLFTDSGLPMLAYWRGDYLVYTGNRYKKISTSDLRSRIIKFFRDDSNLKDKWTRSKTDEILVHLQGINSIDSEVDSGVMLSQPDLKNHFIFAKDKILKLCPRKDWQIEELAHDSNYFSLVALPFNYIPGTECPIFLKFIDEVIPDVDTKQFIQEWFGYNLIHDTTQGKFVVLIGDGANGKSVLLTVLAALVGKENVSGVPLESFSATRTFPMAATIGKLANICDEMGIVRGVESTLKQFVSGAAMNLERKGKDGCDHKPTARLTFATNNLPSFQDHSDGLWRRLVAVPMTIQILDESKQDKRLGQVEFWQQSNEMPGILSWAIIGLQRLMRRKYFVEPEVSKKFKKNYRSEIDGVKGFFESNLEANDGTLLGATTLYLLYVEYSKSLGMVPVSPALFTRLVRKHFPQASLSENAHSNIDNQRQRAWSGIQLIERRF